MSHVFYCMHFVQYADRLYGPEKTQDAAADDHSGDEDDEDDVEAALSKEV